MIEWYFLFSILTHNPDAPDGWDTARYKVVAPSLGACEQERNETYLHYKTNRVEGGGVIITECQPVLHNGGQHE